MEAAPGFEPGVRALQARALPLGYAAGDRGGTAGRPWSQFRERLRSRAVKWLILFTGGGLGAVLRFALALWVNERAQVDFPWGTLAVNGVGCFLIGLVATLADEHHLLTPALRLFLIAGVLGGFTTFSAFGLETWRLVEEGLSGVALGNVIASLCATALAVAAGVLLGRNLA